MGTYSSSNTNTKTKQLKAFTIINQKIFIGISEFVISQNIHEAVILFLYYYFHRLQILWFKFPTSICNIIIHYDCTGIATVIFIFAFDFILLYSEYVKDMPLNML